VASEINRGSWTSRVEEALRGLRGVEGASVIADGDAIREIHILSSSSRPPKQIVRDVETTLLTRFQRSIDHRVVSVAYTRGTAPAAVGEPQAPPGARAEAERIRFVSVNLFVSGPRTQAQVELRWKGLTRMGSATGWTTRQGAYRLVAAATLQAVMQYLEDEVGLGVHDVSFLRMGRQPAAVVSLALVADRREKLLTGTCAVEADIQQSVVLAALGALNRVVGGLRSKEPVEYVVRPTSA
jgi:hypothetical protein